MCIVFRIKYRHVHYVQNKELSLAHIVHGFSDLIRPTWKSIMGMELSGTQTISKVFCPQQNPVYMPMELYVDLVKLFGTLTFVNNC